MLNLLFALCAGALVAALLAACRLLSFFEAMVPGVLMALASYVVLARHSSTALQARPPRTAQATAILQRGYPLARWQFGVRAQLDAQLGVLWFYLREFKRAQPLLARSLLLSPWLAGAMLGVIQYKKKDAAGMKRTFAIVTKKAKKNGLAWNLYAYLLMKLGERDAAQRVLVEGVSRAGPSDPRLREALLALQNGKKFKMAAYGEQWYQFLLENPPASYAQAPRGQAKVGRIARRGRW